MTRENLSGLRVALTGGTGFLGYHIASAFSSAGAKLRVLARPRSDRKRLEPFKPEFQDGDLSDAKALRSLAQGCQLFVHGGGLTQASSDEAYRKINVEGTALALEAAREAGVETFTLVSSLAAAGPSPAGQNALREEDPPRPLSGYGRSKLEAEDLLAKFSGSIPRLVALRPGAVYGPFDRAFLVYFKMISRGIRPVLGRGERIFQAVHAADVAGACLASIKAPRGSPRSYFINPRETLTWEAFSLAVAEACGKRPLTLRLPSFLVQPGILGLIPALRPASDRLLDLLKPRWEADPSRARVELSWEARIPLAQGLKECRNWYQAQGWL